MKLCNYFSPMQGLWWACFPNIRICCLAILSFLCNNSFWPSRVAIWSFSSSVLSVALTFLPIARPECLFLRLDILVENLREKDTENNRLALQCTYDLVNMGVYVCNHWVLINMYIFHLCSFCSSIWTLWLRSVFSSCRQR